MISFHVKKYPRVVSCDGRRNELEVEGTVAWWNAAPDFAFVFT